MKIALLQIQSPDKSRILCLKTELMVCRIIEQHCEYFALDLVLQLNFIFWRVICINLIDSEVWTKNHEQDYNNQYVQMSHVILCLYVV